MMQERVQLRFVLCTLCSGYFVQLYDIDSNSIMQESSKTNRKSRTKSKKEMFKKTRSGQPVMKYRIQKMLDALQQ